MNVDPVTQNEKPTHKLYKEIMNSIEFMEKFKEDPAIFNPDSANFKNFLIQSFCFLYSDFHYLSFLRKEEVDPEIIKVARILQILPANSKKVTKLFENMSKDDIHKFWLRFFSLFRGKNNFTTSSLFNSSCDNKISFFKDMKSTLAYLNYEFPVVNMKKFNCVNVNEEIDNWKVQAHSTVTASQLVSFNNIEEQAVDVDVDKLIIDLKQVLSMYSDQKLVNQQSKTEHIEFFRRFINLTKSILQYKEDLATINSTFLDEFNFNMFSADENLTENLYFIKRCNNLVNTLKSKTKQCTDFLIAPRMCII